MLASNARQTAHCFSIERAQRGVVRVRRVLLKAECRRHEVDVHAERLAQRQHRRGRLRCRQARQLVDGQLAQVTPSDFRRERGVSRAARYLSSRRFIFSQRRPDVGQEPGEIGFVHGEPHRRDARAHPVDECRRDVRLHPRPRRQPAPASARAPATGRT